jgi:predicted DNA-binding protein with PD1-like motif
MSNNKQSSVEWLYKELEDYGTSERLKIDWKTFDELFEQAKAMHEKETINFAQTWAAPSVTKEHLEYFYNETFKNEQQ